ncbi:MAG TPA: M64 family metallopeptidase, partial [Bdellovibrionota bacterium]|nr:M64 family metallopeptidase [Bdellovibrionota bacterium]
MDIRKPLVLGALLVSTVAGAADPQGWLVSRLRTGDRQTVLSVRPTSTEPGLDQVELRSIPERLAEGPGSSTAFYEEIWYRPQALPTNLWPMARAGESDEQEKASWPGSEVRTLTLQGPLANRINLTIVGDGYTAAEKDKFFADAQRIRDDLFGESTFSSYTPLFNVYAVFVPSKQSGITDTVKRDTALGLYRDPPESKRAIMPGNTANIEKALALAPVRADYPILLANDDFYGGLGGAYATTTRSVRSGPVVLRHELGHNFGSVGEEYDNGYVYVGANTSPAAGAQIKWPQWMDAKSKTYETQFLAGAYLWKNLADGAIHVPF